MVYGAGAESESQTMNNPVGKNIPFAEGGLGYHAGKTAGSCMLG